MSYYDDQESVANIYVGLVERGWNCFGYKADESDSMTDYYSPARWEGIAEKNGFVLLVDVYSTSMSGHKVTKKGYTVDYSKISKLQATINDKAASPNEKETAQKIIDSMKSKEKESTVIALEYPTFKNANPKGCNWHIEKDGVIIAKGKGAFQCDGYLFASYREETMKKVNAFIDKIESKINGSEQLEAVQQKIVKKVIKPVEVTDRKTLKVGDVLSFEYHGHFWQVNEVSEKTFHYELLGSEKRGYQKLTNGKRYYDYITTLEKNLANGKIKIYELKEVEEVTYKTVYKAVKRQGQKENLLQGDVVESPVNETVEPKKEVKKAAKVEVKENKLTIENEESLTVELIHNEELNGLELKFSGKPSEGTRELLKENKFRWSKFAKKWWVPKTDKALLFAEAFVSAYNDTIEEVEETPAEEQNNAVETTNEPVETIEETKENPYNSEVQETVNGYTCHFKAWYMEVEEIETRLQAENIPYYLGMEKFFFVGISADQYKTVQAINKENGSILFDDSFESEHVQNESAEVEQPEQTETKEYSAEYTNDNKIKVDSITFLWSESAHIPDNTTVYTFEEAEQLIKNAAFHAPNNGAYDKTKFLITWSDGQTYEGRIDIVKADSFKSSPLKDHIVSFAEHDDSEWHTQEDKEGYKHFINTYTLEEEKQPTSENKQPGKVLDFSSKFKQKQAQKETEDMKSHFLNNVLPYMEPDEINDLQKAYLSKDESQLNQIWQKLMLSTAVKRAADEIQKQN